MQFSLACIIGTNCKCLPFVQHLNSWIPYLNIALIFCVICIYGLGPCEFSVDCIYVAGDSQWYHFSNLSSFSIFFQLECPWLSLLTSSYKHGVHLLTWSVGLSTGWACSLWGCCSATLWWDTCCVPCVTSHDVKYGLGRVYLNTFYKLTSHLSLYVTSASSFNTIWFHMHPRRKDSASSASWSLWLTPFSVEHFCYVLSQRPKEGQWWRLWRTSTNWITRTRVLTLMTLILKLNSNFLLIAWSVLVFAWSHDFEFLG